MNGSTLTATDLPTAAATPLLLRVIGSEHDGRILRIQAAKCTIGSAAGSTLRLKAPGIRDTHCLVLRGPAGLAARSWSPETRLNGQAFSDAPLLVGDRLSIGPVDLEVLDAGLLSTTNDRPAAVPAMAEGLDEAELRELQQQARELTRTREQLAQQLAEREQAVKILEARLSEIDGLVTELRAENSEKQAAMQTTCVDEELLAEREAECARLAAALEAAEQALDAHKIQHCGTSETLAAVNLRAESLAEQVETLERQLLEARARQDSTQSEFEQELSRQREQLAADVRELETQAAALIEREEAFLREQRQWQAELELQTQKTTAITEEEDTYQSPAESMQPLVTAAETPSVPVIEEKSELAEETDETPAATEDVVVEDVIARLSANGLWKSDHQTEQTAEPEMQAEEPATPEPAWKSLVEETPAPQPPVNASHHEEDDSIEAYMRRLLQRVSGETETPRYVPMPSAPVAQAVETQVKQNLTATRVEMEQPFDMSTYVPRSAAPESNANLAAMRALANDSARGALDTNKKFRLQQRAAARFTLSLVSGAAAAALSWLTTQTHSNIAFYGSFLAGLAACGWSIHAGYSWWKLQSQNEEREEPKEKATDATAES